ncbi:MAG: hypothetical protein HQK77_03375 [Desulfobacterales bacterium]|nr:hypothetical protein [Desulfobacterales bacterium]
MNRHYMQAWYIMMFLILCTPCVYAELNQLDDEEMSNIRGIPSLSIKAQPSMGIRDQASEKRVTFDEAYQKPDINSQASTPKTVSFEEAFQGATGMNIKNMTNMSKEQIKEQGIGVQSVKIDMNYKNFDQVFSDVTGSDISIQKTMENLGINMNMNVQVKGDVSVQLRP